MNKTKLKLVYKNDNPTAVRRRDNVLDKDTLIAIDRAESIDFSNLKNNKNFVKVDVNEYLEAMDDEDRELFDFVEKLYSIRTVFYNKIKDDILTFKPYAVLFDIAHENLDEAFVEDANFILSNYESSNKLLVEQMVDLLDEYITEY